MLPRSPLLAQHLTARLFRRGRTTPTRPVLVSWYTAHASSAEQPRHIPWVEGYRKRTRHYISNHCPSVALQANKQTGGQAGGQQTVGFKQSTTGTRAVVVPSLPSTAARCLGRPPCCEHESTRGLQSQCLWETLIVVACDSLHQARKV
jgi:hypothetical protein